MRARLTRSAGRAVVLAQRAAALFPVRVWRRFLRRNGLLLSAGMAYQGLFALFALLYVAFAGVGVWLRGSPDAVDGMIRIANGYLPGIIGSRGVASAAEVHRVVENAGGTFTATALIATAVAAWTAVSAVTLTRRAVRDMFGLPFDTRSFMMLKLADALGAVVFGAALLLGGVLSIGGVYAMAQLFELFGWQLPGDAVRRTVSGVSVLVIIVIDVATIALLVRFLTGTTIRWRRIAPGAAAAGIAVATLQLGAGLLFSHTPANPLLATFAVTVALLLWCRVAAVVILLAASWITLSASDRNEPLERPDEADAARERLVQAERAARTRMLDAESSLADAHWWDRRRRRTELIIAQDDWEDAAAELTYDG